MRKSTTVLALGLGASLLLAGGFGWRTLRAADHADGPATTAEPAADIDDVYTWMSPDATDLNLVMTIGRNVPPTFRLSDRVQYVFHTTSRPSFGAPAGPEYNIICEAEANGQIRCWAGNDVFVGGDASTTAGIESRDARFKVFAGVRNDPFFFNLTGLNTVARTVGTVGGTLTFDAAGCPRLDAATAGSLVTTLRTGRDDFLGFEAFAIVVSIDKSLVTRNGSIVSVYGSTHRKS
jgi:hypothetical protein